ncbi:MAG: hypothetical protein E7J23_10720, partial [Haemophilus parainfluenzae]|nr:hypothetical protein [Haemophilus parainfluenzae]
KQSFVKDSNNYYKLNQNNEIGSEFNIEGDARFAGKNAIEMRGASAVSNGTMSVLSEGDINIHESRQQERLSEATNGLSMVYSNQKAKLVAIITIMILLKVQSWMPIKLIFIQIMEISLFKAQM